MTLEPEELTILIDALDAWVTKDVSGQMFGELMFALVDRPGQKPDGQGKEERAKRQAEYNTARDLRSEQATLLKAKLIQMRRGIRVAQEARR